MSAFIVSPQHIDNIVATAQAYRMMDATPSILGRMLWTENVKSVAYRYHEPVDLTDAASYQFNAYRARSLTAVQALKAIACLEYQSCEHPEWESSAAKRFCDDFRMHAIDHLPGYSDAPWEWVA